MMAGKLCTGAPTNNAGAGILSSSKAYCEGIQWRAQGTAAGFPLTDNPHESGSEDAVAWEAGWTVANTAAPVAMKAEDAPCCSVPQHNIAA